MLNRSKVTYPAGFVLLREKLTADAFIQLLEKLFILFDMQLIEKQGYTYVCCFF